MNSHRILQKNAAGRQIPALLILLAIFLILTARARGATAANLVIWDTGARLAETADTANRAGWKAVPSELFAFEAEPDKAASDPGYYGREYSFLGDTVVENHSLAAVFSPAKGRVVIYAKADKMSPDAAPAKATNFGNKILELAPLQNKSQPAKISRCEILRNAADEVVLAVSFSVPGVAESSATFSFGRDEIVEVKPTDKLRGVSLFAPIEYGVVPGFIGDDLIFSAADHTATDSLSLPVENVFVGLLRGEGEQIVMTWPKGKQQLKLRLGGDAPGQRAFESMDFENDGQSFYLAAMSAPGIWHREELKPAYLEKEVALKWKKPFPARWKTQLTEAGVRTTFAFREAKGTVWRGVPGSYDYPVWFDGDAAFFHLSKKVPPKGESLVYFLEGQNTPLSVSTPVDVVKATLGRQLSDTILDPAGQKLRTHHRRGGDGVHRACTCGYTEAIQSVFEKGEEGVKKGFVQDCLGDMEFFVDRHVARIDEYQRFAAEMIQFLKTKTNASPELKSYLENLQQIVEQIPQEYAVQKENMKSSEHMAELTRKTMALTASKATNNLPAYMELLKAWRAMGGAQDYVVAQCHTLTRKLFQEAGYGCARDAKLVPVAQEIRARCRQVLRNPDGYEIWANY